MAQPPPVAQDLPPRRRPVPLAAFDLLEPIGYGGGASVWRGQHRKLGTPVAVKVLTGRSARDPVFIAGFHREIQTIAGLDHPAIIYLFDHGEVSQSAAELSRGALIAGSPYLVMELSPRGPLTRSVEGRTVPWPEIRPVLDAVLDALAYAHARGFIHRDIKPDNLLGFEGDGPPWRLTDFGIAHLIDAAADSVDVMGTPGYMAPEQVRGDARSLGPWTDLYALGCLAYQLIWGRLPYPYAEAQRFIYAQMESPAPRLPLPEGIPAGVDAWVHRLLERDPARRLRRAADAAWALSQLDAQSRSPSFLGAFDGWAAMETRQFAMPVDVTEAQTLIEGPSEALEGATWPPAGDSGPVSSDTAPPIPDTWRRPGIIRSRTLVEAGQRLFGLRPLPLVGRDAALTTLWQALRGVGEDGRARVILIHGPAGTGKSRLVEWLCERAHEVGAATLLVASFGADAGPSDGLDAMVARHFKCLDLDREAVRARMDRELSRLGPLAAGELDALVDLAAPAHEPPDAPRPGTARARFAALRRLLQILGRERPVILWLDDAHEDPEVLAFARWLLEERGHRDAPVLVLATLRTEGLEARPDAHAMARSIVTYEGASALAVGSLSDEDTASLARALLHLREELVETVVSWSGGLPVAAVQLVASWAHQGILVPGPDGLAMADGRVPTGPPSLQRMWAQRLDRLLSERRDSDRLALELGATLGLDVPEDLWQAACDVVGVDPAVDLIEALVERRLARWREGGWAFVHTTLREVLEASAREAGRWRDHHLACARALAGLTARGGRRGLAERIALHLVEGGQREQALTPLLEAAGERWRRGDFVSSAHLLDRAEQLLRLTGALEDDRRWGEVWLLRGRLLNSRGRPEEAARWAERCAELAARSDDDALRAHTALLRGAASFRLGRYDDAAAQYQDAMGRFEDLGEGTPLGDALLGMGEIARLQGETARAQSFYARAIGRYQAEENLHGVARTFHAMAALTKAWDLDLAVEHYRRAMGLYERLGNRALIQACINGLADVDRRRGLLDAAEARWREVLAFYEATGAPAARAVRVNLALVAMDRGQFDQARLLLEAVQVELKVARQVDILGDVHAALARCAAARRDFPAVDAHLREVAQVLSATSAVDRDQAQHVHEAAALAEEAGHFALARRAFDLAGRQWRGLRDAVHLAEVRAALGRLAAAR